MREPADRAAVALSGRADVAVGGAAAALLMGRPLAARLLLPLGRPAAAVAMAVALTLTAAMAVALAAAVAVALALRAPALTTAALTAAALTLCRALALALLLRATGAVVRGSARTGSAGSAAMPFGNSATGTFRRVTFSMSRRNARSSSSQNEIAMPAAPARAVRPMRWT